MRAERALGLDVDLPLAAEAIEVVDEGAAHEGLDGLVNARELHALLQRAVLVDVDETLGHVGVEGTLQRGDFGPLLGRGAGTCPGCPGGTGRSLPERSCRMKVTPPAVPMPGMGGGGKAKPTHSGSVRIFSLRLVKMARTFSVLEMIQAVAFIPRLEGDEEKAAVGVLHVLIRLKPTTVVQLATPGTFSTRSSTLFANVVRALERGGGRKHNDRIGVALVFLVDEAGGQVLVGPPDADHGHDQDERRDGHLADEEGADIDVGGRGRAERAIEAAEEIAERTAAFRARPQQHGGKRGAERQGVEGGDQHRDGDGDGELLVEPARDAGNEDGRDEDGGENQGDGDDGAGDLVHRLERGVLRAKGPSRCDARPPRPRRWRRPPPGRWRARGRRARAC